MAYRIDVRLRVSWVPDGAGSAFLGQNQSNQPGTGASLAASTIAVGDSLDLFQGETVPGGDSPSAGNFTTALTNAATDLGTQLSTAGAWAGNPGTPLAIIQSWSTGGPSNI